MSVKLKSLYDQRAKAWQEAQDIRARMEADGYDPNDNDNTTFSRALTDVERLSQDIETEERIGRLDKVMTGATDLPAPTRAASDEDAQYAKAFDAYMRNGINGLEVEQRQMLMKAANPFDIRAQGTTSGSVGGYLIPTETLNRMTETLKAFGGIMGVANVLNTGSGNPINWPSNDDTANVGAILTENTQITAQDLAFGQKTLGAYTYTSKLILVSWQLLQDQVFNLDGFIARKVGERIGRALSAHLASGSGSGQPEGLFTNATTGKTGTTGQTTSVIYDDLIDLIHSVDPAYRTKGRFVMADSSLKVIRKLKDSQNRPLWEPSVQTGVPDNLLAYPVTIDQGAPTMAASAKSIGFGDINAGYIVRQVAGGQLVRLEERYADYLQTGFFGFLRLDGKPDDGAAFRVYVNSAT